MEKPKRILIFSTAYYPFVGGAEVAIKEITDRITNIDFDLITAKLSPNLLKFERIDNVNVYRLGFGIPVLDKLFLPFLGAFKALKLNSKNNYKFYWGMMATFGSGAAYLANIFNFWKPVPIILTLQEGDSEKHFKYRWLGLINLSWWLALKNTKVLTVLSSYLAERAQKFGYKGEIKIIANGVYIEKFDIDLSLTEKDKIRSELRLEEKDVALVTTSRLVIKNGVGDVIKALVKLPTNIKFVVFGEGYMDKELKQLAQDLKVSDRVIFRGLVSHVSMPKYLKACDIFIRASLSEGFGNSFIEAMACKLPVIASPVGGVIDFLKDGETGYFCEAKNPESIAQTVERVISDSNKDKITEQAFKMVTEKYEWNLIADKMKGVFNKI